MHPHVRPTSPVLLRPPLVQAPPLKRKAGDDRLFLRPDNAGLNETALICVGAARFPGPRGELRPFVTIRVAARPRAVFWERAVHSTKDGPEVIAGRVRVIDGGWHSTDGGWRLTDSS